MEAAGIVEVVKVIVTKKTTRRRDYRAKKIGVEEDTIEEEVADQTFSAINEKNMVIMRMIVTPKNVTIVAKWGTLQKHVEPEKGWKEQLTWSWKT